MQVQICFHWMSDPSPLNLMYIVLVTHLQSPAQANGQCPLFLGCKVDMENDTWTLENLAMSH
jgi:hypothetical protein